MLQRKPSVVRVAAGDGLPLPMIDFSTQIGGMQEDIMNDSIALNWINRKWFRRLIHSCALLSFISICLNTPATIKNSVHIYYFTFVVDCFCSLLFAIEMITKIKSRTLFTLDNGYLYDRWCQFDFMMVLFHWISIAIQVS